MAIACFGLVTRLPLRPLFSSPCFISFISFSTYFPALGPYLRPRLEVDFFDDEEVERPPLDEELRDFAVLERRLFAGLLRVEERRVDPLRDDELDLPRDVFFAELLRAVPARLVERERELDDFELLLRRAPLFFAVLRREDDRDFVVAMLCLL
jgi:hypothetical protein